MMDRRGFMKSILATGVAPYVITTSGLLMPVKKILTPEFGITDFGSLTSLVNQSYQYGDGVDFADRFARLWTTFCRTEGGMERFQENQRLVNDHALVSTGPVSQETA